MAPRTGEFPIAAAAMGAPRVGLLADRTRRAPDWVLKPVVATRTRYDHRRHSPVLSRAAPRDRGHQVGRRPRLLDRREDVRRGDARAAAPRVDEVHPRGPVSYTHLRAHETRHDL